MSPYNFDEDLTYQTYMKESVIDSTIEKPVTIQRLCQRVKEELKSHQLKNKKMKNFFMTSLLPFPYFR